MRRSRWSAHALQIESGTNAAMRAVAGDDAATQLRCRIFASRRPPSPEAANSALVGHRLRHRRSRERTGDRYPHPRPSASMRALAWRVQLAISTLQPVQCRATPRLHPRRLNRMVPISIDFWIRTGRIDAPHPGASEQIVVAREHDCQPAHSCKANLVRVAESRPLPVRADPMPLR